VDLFNIVNADFDVLPWKRFALFHTLRPGCKCRTAFAIDQEDAPPLSNDNQVDGPLAN
jgi:hypothetical protein